MRCTISETIDEIAEKLGAKKCHSDTIAEALSNLRDAVNLEKLSSKSQQMPSDKLVIGNTVITEEQLKQLLVLLE